MRIIIHIEISFCCVASAFLNFAYMFYLKKKENARARGSIVKFYFPLMVRNMYCVAPVVGARKNSDISNTKKNYGRRNARKKVKKFTIKKNGFPLVAE